MSTRLYTHDSHLQHETPEGHPERADRMRAIEVALDHEHFDGLERLQSPKADLEYALYAHPQAHVDFITSSIPEEGLVNIDGDTYVSPNSLEAALRGVGGAISAVDDVFNKKANNVFVAARPPGHHAEKMKAMGFCLFNQAAIAARYAQRKFGAEKIAIVDWDVHHGNGTQDIFYDDPSVTYCSTHQMPLFPGTGGKNETGVGNIFNAPLSPNEGSDHFREAFKSVILPAVENSSPDLIIISAGFDAHHRDPLAQINLTVDDFDWASGKLMEIAGKNCDNRVVSLLEGGYDLVGLSESVATHVSRMMKG